MTERALLDTGPLVALLDADARELIEEQVGRVERVEIAVEDAFQEHFVAAMALPHATDSFPQLEKKRALPLRSARSARKRSRRRDSRSGR